MHSLALHNPARDSLLDEQVQISDKVFQKVSQKVLGGIKVRIEPLSGARRRMMFECFLQDAVARDGGDFSRSGAIGAHDCSHHRS